VLKHCWANLLGKLTQVFNYQSGFVNLESYPKYMDSIVVNFRRQNIEIERNVYYKYKI